MPMITRQVYHNELSFLAKEMGSKLLFRTMAIVRYPMSFLTLPITAVMMFPPSNRLPYLKYAGDITMGDPYRDDLGIP